MQKKTARPEPHSTGIAQRAGRPQLAEKQEYLAEGNAKSSDLSALQTAANANPSAQRLAALQRKANARQPGQAPALQRAEEDDPLQGKLIQREERGAKQASGGLPGGLRTGIESLSGMSMDGVQVHRNSGAPAQVGAHAYAQGRDIHLGPGQERHLPHEAWHVVQQAQGRVRPTIQAKGLAINGDAGLEREADVMGARAMQGPTADAAPLQAMRRAEGDAMQLQVDPEAMGEIARQISALPEVGEDALPSDAQVSGAQQSGAAIGKELEPLTKGNPEVAEFIYGLLSKESQSEAAPKAPPLQGAKVGSGAGPASKPAAPKEDESKGKGGMLGKVKGLFGFGQKGTAQTKREGAVAQLWPWDNDPHSSIANQEMEGAIGGKAAKGVLVGGKVAAVASRTQPLAYLAYAGASTNTALGQALGVFGTVAGFVGLFFGAISTMMDIRALVSSKRKGDALKELAEQERGNHADHELIDAIHYAMRQKYAKAIRRSINLSGTVLAAGGTITLMAIGGVAALASNPVGWGIAIGLIGVGTLIGLGLLAYKIGRYFYKKKKGVLSQRRREVANFLYDSVVEEPNHGAGRALSVLGLDPHEMHEAANYGRQDAIRNTIHRLDTMLDPQFNGYEEDPKKQKGLRKRIAGLRAKLSKVGTSEQAALDKVEALEVTCEDAYQTFYDRRNQEMDENMALIWNDTGGSVRLKWARWRHKRAQANLDAAKDNLRNQQHPDIRGAAIKLIMGKLSK